MQRRAAVPDARRRGSRRRATPGARRALRLATAVASFAAAACTTQPGGGGSAGADAAADSIVLERTVCFGFCPAYRLALGANGAVLFELQGQRGAPDARQRDTIPASAVATLLARAREIGFFSLPDEITPANGDACPLAATDHPSAIVTIATRDTVKRVNHYHGCHSDAGGSPSDAYPALTALENAIDSAAGVARWLSQR